MFVLLVVLLCLAEGFAVNGIANAALVHLEKQVQASLFPTCSKSDCYASYRPDIVHFNFVEVGVS